MQVSPLDHSHVSSKVVSFSQLIHPTALISPYAKIGPNVSIGPYSIIGDNVSIGQGTTIGSHVSIQGWTQIGEDNQIETGAIIGAVPQDLKFAGEKSTVFIGNNNIIREYVTINRGTAGGGGETRVGNHNLIMTSVHVAHDVQMGNNNIIANAVAIGGHVVIDDWVTIGALCGIHQFVQLGRMSMIGAQSKITKDVLPYTLVSGNPPKRFGINVERLRRNGYSSSERIDIQRAYKILFQEGQTLTDTIEMLKKEFQKSMDVNYILKFLENSKRSFYR
ncbi:TPA: acyl-ACP--UDP-N-acetylglucosamine O-acyltransferase [Legionella pneumophila subsp. pneumophila]|uniref:Acyl-[acyl-carrier-protein]--UDP-N-acetylglucosamine O-acyltransferase n=1 Tax=Legionella pneumophila TaxID=446 RepID=A0A2S6F903_LEGPN|nr:acyl-ACP--UDP-N-acetylglucosamine O-acyltransferase [Legionella pneumophila]APF04639.1 acyl-[acyl-carrier-protein]--UDP-N-acetylglucosamine O-acyltransferase [Legionella pneumophila subsp. fraseri]APF07628.1 acyl-[acyl-carrier-protein]--UDP-N-acetylglucosamine O-acyltransferase [Legionella pneumophila subsp. fraseri]AUB70079.1 acyl-[acyl-carrier-protein]--UDP-N-acetylglucosamine O-acyltransferase [Legionella pneumophila]AUB73054.1 acyl-[acyl-carrier-protein]--UDP-N-acetylglucosamine O-acyltr